MLKSTHRPTAPPPLPQGWTEHKAPSGHTYYYNTATKKSTYTRPVEQPAPIAAGPPTDPSLSFLSHQAVPNLFPAPGPAFGNNAAFQPQFNAPRGGGFQHGRGGKDRPENSRPRPQPTDKPKSKRAIPGCEPWFLIDTKLGRRFVYNQQKNQSYWRIPDKLKDGILQLDQLRIREKAGLLTEPTKTPDTESKQSGMQGAAPRPITQAPSEAPNHEGEDDSEYEEVEVTDDEDGDDPENPAKRLKTGEEANADDPVEFGEDDIAYQLAAMGQDFGQEQGEYDEEEMADWQEGTEAYELSAEDGVALFKDLLNDFGINPYSPWDKLVEEGKLVDDSRYVALPNMKARKEAWEEWSRDKIKLLREQRAKEEKNDPRIPYLAFLQKHATPKLYWPEFKRKYKKEPEMRDTSLLDKDREKIYREHIARLKQPQSTLKSDMLALLKAQPLSALNNTTLASHLPSAILTDIRYISLDASIRDPLIEAFISTLPPPPDVKEEEESEDAVKERQERQRRQRALEERERQVAEEKRRQKRNLAYSRENLRAEEAEIERAMNVSKKGLMDYLTDEKGA